MRRVPGILAALLAVGCATGATSPPSATSTPGGPPITDHPSQIAPSTCPATPGLSAYELLDPDALAATLGAAPTVLEDDGVIPGDGASIGQARALTHDGVILQLTLTSAQAAGEALSRYEDRVNYYEASPLPGVGERAASAAGYAVVLTGAQLLEVTADPGPDAQARLDAIKLQGGDPSSELQAMLGVVAIAVPALAAGMTGEPTTCLAIGIPADGIDPCVLSAAEVEAIVGVPVSATVVDSLNPPWQECEYRFEPSGLLAVGTVSDARLRNSVTPTTAAQDYATQLAEAQARGPVQTVDQLGFKGAAEQDDRRGIQAHVLLQADVFNYHGYLIERRSFGGMPFGDLRTCEIIVEEIERKQAEREASEARSRDELNRLLLDINPAISILAGYACHPYRL